ncbi:hypothetical protein ZIOFF_049961 [Zingiber officinale]|uniref:Uncharacterized protein n=1 Tax=Zingiber officinale TaxID=94328 RepID=A0A8J5FFU7_ZINOF|nr:hypothetical protein ZIOFF_049961 [Zingiber officinale]
MDCYPHYNNVEAHVVEGLGEVEHAIDVALDWQRKADCVRLGRGIHLLKEKNMVVGLPNIQIANNVCEGCVYEKMHKLLFPKLSWRAKAYY